MDIPKLPVFTTEAAIDCIKKNFGNIKKWKEINYFIPKKFRKSINLKKTGLAGIFGAALELSKEGSLEISQKKIFGNILIKEKKNET